MDDLNHIELQALQYVVNTGFSVGVAGFDDDHDPIGLALRARLMPKYMIEESGKLTLTPAGCAALGKE